MSRLILDIKSVEEEFFPNQRLLAISAPTLPDYRFCWLLNTYLDMAFERQRELDIELPLKQPKKISKLDLFSTDKAVSNASQSCFSVYKSLIEGSESAAFLYSNHCEGYILISEMKPADFFILYPENSLLPVGEKLQRCREFKAVTWVRQLNINELKSKDVLIL